jgi:acetyl-CoA C-acetyltransferase/acetyl-CoA acyltransferase
MEALSQGYDKIKSGRSELIFAGGVENMSKMPLIYNKEMTDFFIEMMKAKGTKDRVKALMGFRFPHLSPIIAIEQGLTDPFCGKNMGQTAEILARELGISREQQDEFANNSHYKAVTATQEGKFDNEILPIAIGERIDKVLLHDNGPRAKSTMESLAKLKPYFEKNTGSVTVGNSCPITDGGSVLFLASENAVKKYNLKVRAKIVDYHFHGLEPERMGMGPLVAMKGVLDRAKMTLAQMDLVEINEAFAAQTLAVLMAVKDQKISRRWGIEESMGEIPPEKLNVNGGAIALGHPVGSTGSRLVVTLLNALEQKGLKTGIASLCIGGGQGGAMIIERI